MGAHTPGPLHVEHDDEALATYVTRPDGMTTACCSWTLIGGPSKDEQSANGTLYAAAPDLLEACEDAHTELLLLHQQCVTARRLESLIQKLQDAIARTEGE